MKITVNKIAVGEDEVIVNYREMTPQIQRILDVLYEKEHRMIGWKERQQYLLSVSDILYLESVDNKVYAYTSDQVYGVDLTLAEAEKRLDERVFFRCSKSMIINICRVQRLQSLPGNRIDAQMENQEHVMISRTYASSFRKRLKGGRNNE